MMGALTLRTLPFFVFLTKLFDCNMVIFIFESKNLNVHRRVQAAAELFTYY